MNRPKLLLLDADVIVFAHELGVWDALKKEREHESHLAKGKTRRITGECFKKPPF